MSELKFTCSICVEPSGEICRGCTKDTCENHLCKRCSKCSDCCTCDVPLDDSLEAEASSNGAYPIAGSEPA